MLAVSGSGDIAPSVPLVGGDTASDSLLFGLVVALIVLIVIATMFITSEYRRGLIRTTFAATPNRCRVLAAKAVVVGLAAFVIAAVAAAAAIPLAALAVGTILRRSAGTTLVGVAVFVLPTFTGPGIIGPTSSDSAGTWLYRLTPAAGFSVLGLLPRSSLVSYPYTMANGY